MKTKLKKKKKPKKESHPLPVLRYSHDLVFHRKQILFILKATRMGLQSEFRRGVNKIDGMNVSGEEGTGMGFYGPNTLSFLPTQAILSLINRRDDN